MLSVFYIFEHEACMDFHPLPLHDALPICGATAPEFDEPLQPAVSARHSSATAIAPRKGLQAGIHPVDSMAMGDRKSTRLNSSHMSISYAVFCLKNNMNFYHYLALLTKLPI